MSMPRPNPRAALTLAAPLLLALAGCGADTSRSLGFTRDPPDEFQVTTRAPLSVPPRLGELPVPTPGSPRPQETRSAASILVPGTAAAQPSAAERALVAQAGAPAEAGIRRRVDEESLRLDAPPRGVVDTLRFWRPAGPAGITVDPTRESQRLRENAALGRDSTEGQTPVVQPRQRTLWEMLSGS